MQLNFSFCGGGGGRTLLVALQLCMGAARETEEQEQNILKLLYESVLRNLMLIAGPLRFTSVQHNSSMLHVHEPRSGARHTTKPKEPTAHSRMSIRRSSLL
jgi:hypothetical protein